MTTLGATASTATFPAAAADVSAGPANADYLVGTANGGLSAEIVVGTSPGGELGGTWASPTVDSSHAGGTHAASQAAAEATAAAALTAHETDATMAHLLSGVNVNWSQGQQIPSVGANARIVSGMQTPPANSGTTSSGDDADGPSQLLTTAATTSTECTMYSASEFRRDWGTIGFGAFKTPSAFVVLTINAGLASGALGTGDVPAVHCAVFRYKPAVDGTAFWRTVTNDATTGTVTTTAVAVTADTVYRWAIRMLPSSVEFWMATGDGALALVATHSATLPTATTLLAFITRVITHENVAKTMRWLRHSYLKRG